MKHLALSIFSSTLLMVSWLFYNTSKSNNSGSTSSHDYSSEIQEIKTSIDRQNEVVNDVLTGLNDSSKNTDQSGNTNTASDSKYTIIVQDQGLNRVFLLNTETGESWRYYVNQGKSEGWSFMNFNASGVDFASAEEGKDFVKKLLKRDR